MIPDDTTAIPTGGCVVLTASDTLSWYSGRTRRDYSLNGGRWVEWRHSTSNYSDYDISSYNCIDRTTLYSYEYLNPFYYLIPFMLFIISILFFRWAIRGVLGRF